MCEVSCLNSNLMAEQRVLIVGEGLRIKHTFSTPTMEIWRKKASGKPDSGKMGHVKATFGVA